MWLQLGKGIVGLILLWLFLLFLNGRYYPEVLAFTAGWFVLVSWWGAHRARNPIQGAKQGAVTMLPSALIMALMILAFLAAFSGTGLVPALTMVAAVAAVVSLVGAAVGATVGYLNQKKAPPL